jgi:DNA repair exonuclease SbcCD nuclease subunit
MTRVIHTGDTHLGYRQYHSAERREDFLRAFEAVITDAVDSDVDAVVHAGDLFHDRRPGLSDLLGTIATLRELRTAEIPFLAIVGNHEIKRDAQWIDLFADLGLAVRLGAEPVTVGDTAFYGLDYVPESQREALEYRFEPHDATYASLVTHGLFAPFDHGNWDVEHVLEKSPIAFDAVLMGDNHKRQVTRAEAGTWLTYCGSTERTSASEQADRGYNIVSYADDEDEPQVSITRRGLETREFRFIDVELGEGDGIERVLQTVSQYEHTDAVSIVTVEGGGEQFSPAPIEEAVKEAGALIVRVNDRRTLDTEQEMSVSFADPDEAVRDRIREMQLSGAATEIDELVRASKLADSALAEAVEKRVGELLETEVDRLFEQAAPAPEEPADATGGDPAAEPGEKPTEQPVEQVPEDDPADQQPAPPGGTPEDQSSWEDFA